MKTEDIINRTVIANRLDSITGEMGLSLEHSAHSPIFAEACDFACCICDNNGDLVSQLSGIPILATAGSFSVKSVIKEYGKNIHDGDVFIINDPYYGGNHLPDIGIITPVFYDDELLFFCVSRAHHGDIGGSTAGSYNPKATEIFQEGIRILPTRLMQNNIMLDDILKLIISNTRNPSMLKSDLLAQIGSNSVASKRIKKMVEQYNPETVKKVVKENLKQAEILTKKRINEIPDGKYNAYSYIDDDSFQKEPIKINVTVIIKGDNLTVDFTGTDKQVKGFVNTSIVTATTASGIATLWFLGKDIPRNGGAFNAINVVLPKGSLVNPYEPAPMTLSTLTPASEIIGTIFQALNKAVSDRLPAGYASYIGPSYYGIDPRNSRFYVGFSFCSIGSGGAMKGIDGKPYMSPMSNFGGVKAPNIESNEVQYPHITLCHEMDPDTCGAGEFRGGAGIKYSFKIYDDSSEIVMFGDGLKNAPYGLNGGNIGSFNKGVFYHENESIVMESKEYPRKVSAGDIVCINSAGGGGWGDPKKRDFNLVLEDFLDGIISKDVALNVYGVKIDDNNQVDIAETNKLRKDL
ncbi:MAG: hydantoinase B/oxoprolinase family protein [Methanobacteriaceae archaeon]|nr:hydantoinase B/oxoprolinase family protein [Methanobacteriaceae archaeon]